MTSNNTTSVLEEQGSAVRAVIGEVSRAWADGDAEAFTGRYAEDATVILPGVYLPGRDAIRATMAAAFAGPLKGSRRIHEVQSIRFRDDGTAIMISNSVTVFPGEAEPPADRRERATWVLTRHHDRWLIDAYHSCPQHAA